MSEFELWCVRLIRFVCGFIIFGVAVSIAAGLQDHNHVIADWVGFGGLTLAIAIVAVPEIIRLTALVIKALRG